MNARDSNISQFILSKHKQLLKILMQKMRAFLPLVIFLGYLLSWLDNISCKQSTESFNIFRNDFNRNDKKSVHLNMVNV